MYKLDHNNKSFWNMFIHYYQAWYVDLKHEVRWFTMQTSGKCTLKGKVKIDKTPLRYDSVYWIFILYLSNLSKDIHFFPTLFAYCYILSLNRFVYSVTSCSLNKIIWLTNVHQNQTQLYICSFFFNNLHALKGYGHDLAQLILEMYFKTL